MPRTCPRDGGALREEGHASLHVDHCGACRGIFLDGIEVHRIVGDKELAFELASRRGKAHEAPLACPACLAPMALSSLDGLVVDHCRACLGVWLDAGELSRLADRSTPFGRSRAAALNGALRDVALALRRT